MPGELRTSPAAVDLSPDEFRDIGHRLVDRLADFLSDLPRLPVTPAETPAQVRSALSTNGPLPDTGLSAAAVVSDAAEKLIAHSLFNGHPRFLAYITSSAMPIGALADLMASLLNCNVGGWKLAPAATEIEAQTVRWIAEFIGYDLECGGLLVSGGNMANFVGFIAARAAMADAQVREQGVRAAKPLRAYCSRETHTWIQKAADLSGLGTECVRWIDCDDRQRMDVSHLRRRIEEDTEAGDQPFLVVGTAGSVSTGSVDPLREISDLCDELDLWFHVDGAYGGLAAAVPGADGDLPGLARADSVAVDPHKWLYAPLEAGCILVRRPQLLRDAFSYHPPYYNFDAEAINYFDFGPQNSRGFRALKIWLGFQQAGRSGFQQTIADDIALAKHAFQRFAQHADFEAITQNLSICTFRYVPPALRSDLGSDEVRSLLNELNRSLLSDIENSGSAFLSNAVVNGNYLLRMCIVNFRTQAGDIDALPGLIAELGARRFSSMQRRAAR